MASSPLRTTKRGLQRAARSKALRMREMWSSLSSARRIGSHCICFQNTIAARSRRDEAATGIRDHSIPNDSSLSADFAGRKKIDGCRCVQDISPVRELDPKAAALVQFGLHSGFSAEALDRFGNDREPDAGPGISAADIQPLKHS